MINFDWQQTGSNPENGAPKKLKRSTMISVIALTTLASMTVTGCTQAPVNQATDKDKEKEERTAGGHSHGYHGGHFSGGGSARAARSKQYGRTKSGSTVVKATGYQAPPANAWGGVSRGWFGRFCGSVFGG